MGIGLCDVGFCCSAVTGLEWVEKSTKTIGATTITWDSSFQALDYTVGDIIIMKVRWSVDEGAAYFDRFEEKQFIPKSKKDPAKGELIVVSPDENAVEVEFKFTGLHLDKKRMVDIGDAHLKLYLMIDKDGDGIPESMVGYGVNVHVEEPR